MNGKIGFIGAGNMGGALICSAIENSEFNPNDICVHSLTISDRVKKLNINVTTLQDLVTNSDYIILCIKPNGFKTLLENIKTIDDYESKVYVSIAAGITIDAIKDILGDVKIVRTMPNLALTVGAGMTVLSGNEYVTDDEFNFVDKLFSGAGKTLTVPEKLIDQCTAISGSGPAYGFMFIEALADAAVKGGIARTDAYLMAAQTLMGSALMCLETGLHPGVLKDMVCSPGGTTIEAVASLERTGFRASVIEAVDACSKKAENMGK